MKEIQVYELEDTNLLYIVLDSNSGATYYSKSNLTVEAIKGFVVIRNEGLIVLSELPIDFVNPKEKSVVDLVEIIQGYINNIVLEKNEELTTLKDLLKEQKETNKFLELIERMSRSNEELIEHQKVTNLHLQTITNEEFKI